MEEARVKMMGSIPHETPNMIEVSCESARARGRLKGDHGHCCSLRFTVLVGWLTLSSSCQILLNFVDLKYEQTRRVVGYEIAVETIKVCEQLVPPPPDVHAQAFPHDFTSSVFWER